MREILFRGKAIDNNWYYGVPLVFTEDYVCITAPHTFNKAVIPETVGQYTGLTDRNGKKIFEGDLLSINGNDTLVFVEYMNSSEWSGYMTFSWICRTNKHPLYYHTLENKPCKYEIIGNIHDNPELLKGEQR